MRNGKAQFVVPETPKVEIPVDKPTYLSLMNRYNKAETDKVDQFEWVAPNGKTYQLVTRYAYYLLELMAVRLGVPMKEKSK